VQGYKVIADENTNPGKYGFRIIHETEVSHYFCFEEQLPVREWMKALMKATIDRDYSRKWFGLFNTLRICGLLGGPLIFFYRACHVVV
jgi:hypothetical protein